MKKFIVEFSNKDFEKIKNFSIKKDGEFVGLEDSEYFESFLQRSFEECDLQVKVTVKSCA